MHAAINYLCDESYKEIKPCIVAQRVSGNSAYNNIIEVTSFTGNVSFIRKYNLSRNYFSVFEALVDRPWESWSSMLLVFFALVCVDP